MEKFPMDGFIAGGSGEMERWTKERRTVLCLSFLLTAGLFALAFFSSGPAPGADSTPARAEGSTEQKTGQDTEIAVQTEADRANTPRNVENTADHADAPRNVENTADHADAPQNVKNTMGYVGERDGERILKVLLHESGKVVAMDLGSYITGVVRGEMPASFETEALKAQAVAARSYTRYMLRSKKHGGKADMCTDFNCCQAYVSKEAARKNWGGKAAEYEEKISGAVADTDGEVLLYDGAPILAVFHASSAGLTRTAEDVWSGGQPYLRPVDSPEDAAHIPNYYSRVDFTAKEFQKKVCAAYPEAKFSAPMEQWIADVERDSADSVITLRVGGVSMRGSKLRTILGLRSACFNWEIRDGKLIFYVTGFGHGVGLSQYGANAMAKNGADYREILTHYYTGVTLGGVS